MVFRRIFASTTMGIGYSTSKLSLWSVRSLRSFGRCVSLFARYFLFLFRIWQEFLNPTCCRNQALEMHSSNTCFFVVIAFLEPHVFVGEILERFSRSHLCNMSDPKYSTMFSHNYSVCFSNYLGEEFLSHQNMGSRQ